MNYLCALEVANKLKLKKYLDYGSGVGSGAILFLKNGFDVSCADISEPLLTFAKWRIKKRKLRARFIDLKSETPDAETFDMITCFDVLEHATNPKKILLDLRSRLKKGGILILNNAECELDKNKPMHISRVGLEKKLRGYGFEQVWHKKVLVLIKAQRPKVLNILYLALGSFDSSWLINFLKRIGGAKYYKKFLLSDKAKSLQC
jgi:2-polyprenyl-3-methyl-5-hydroxy-6-metoxy-1,4-benzoquinol methylase